MPVVIFQGRLVQVVFPILNAGGLSLFALLSLLCWFFCFNKNTEGVCVGGGGGGEGGYKEGIDVKVFPQVVSNAIMFHLYLMYTVDWMLSFAALRIELHSHGSGCHHYSWLTSLLQVVEITSLASGGLSIPRGIPIITQAAVTALMASIQGTGVGTATLNVYGQSPSMSTCLCSSRSTICISTDTSAAEITLR